MTSRSCERSLVGIGCTYSPGRIGTHNVVIACPPAGKTGIGSAANIAERMKRTFPSLRFGLMVGIGGGVSSADNDIRLGDVVVSKPDTQYGGVVQYDFERTIKEGRLILTGALNQPPTKLLTAVNKLRSIHTFGQYGFVQHLSKMPPESLGEQEDRLFEAGYDHVKDEDNTTCIKCEVGRLKKRHTRENSSRPRIFYGTIACANRFMEHGETRDRIAQQSGVLCFAMEDAELMNDFPCLVIRGICDYADSHKNKKWQPYAAATAAAYTKDLLSVLI